MMTLYEKIKAIYPELEMVDFLYTIRLQDDGQGAYIKEWNHPTLARPTDEQLNQG
jgi:hypothetical protein